MGARQRSVDVERRLDKIEAAFSGQLGFAAKNLATGEVIERNSAVSLPTASVIKLAVLAAVYRQVADSQIDLQQRLPLRASDIVGGSGILKELAPA